MDNNDLDNGKMMFAMIILFDDKEASTPISTFINNTANEYFTKYAWVNKQCFLGISENSKFKFARLLEREFPDRSMKFLSTCVEYDNDNCNLTLYYRKIIIKKTDRFTKGLEPIDFKKDEEWEKVGTFMIRVFDIANEDYFAKNQKELWS